jgi:hypothetical protein
LTENLEEIIGFDLGDGETALARIRLGNPDYISDPDPIEIMKGKKNIITAIGYRPTGVTIGDLAITNQVINESYMNFKRVPDDDPLYLRIMHDYIKSIVDKLDPCNRIFVVGCPSKWVADTGKKESIVKRYENIFSSTGIGSMMVISESLAALFHAYECGIFTVEEMKHPILTIDAGSSTTDFTLIDLNSKTSIPINSGCELGARLIDNAILQYTCEHHPQQNEIREILDLASFHRNRCLLKCRHAKEEYYSCPENYKEDENTIQESVRLQKLVFAVELNESIMNTILNMPLVKISDNRMVSWPEAFKLELKRLAEKGISPKTILMTGGASRMNFIPLICKQVFPDAKFKKDDSPEFSIAKGLARYGRYCIRAENFREEVNNILNYHLNGIVLHSLPELIDRIGDDLSIDIINNIIKPKLKYWRGSPGITIKDLQRDLHQEIEKLMASDEINKRINGEISQWIKNIAEEIDRLTIPISDKYNLGKNALSISGIELNKWPKEIDKKPFSSGFITDTATGITTIITAIVVGAILIALTAFTEGIALILISIISLVIGAAVGDKIKNWMEDQEMPIFLKEGLLSDSRIDEESKKMKSAISSDIKMILNEDKGLTEKLMRDVEKSLKIEVLERADSAFSRIT